MSNHGREQRQLREAEQQRRCAHRGAAAGTELECARGAAYGVVAMAFLLVLLWGPTPVTRTPVGIALLAVLLGLGVETLRRQAVREFPDASCGDAMRRVRERLGRLRRARRGDAAAAETRTPIEALERLAALHDRGVLDDDEFRVQKHLLLHGS